MKRRFLLAASFTLLLAGCGSSGSPRPDLAFVSSRDGAYQLYGMNVDGSRQKRLTHEQGDPSTLRGLFYQVEPAWSPDGKLIAFSSKRDGASHLFVMRADGSRTRRLTDTQLEDNHPTWSPDGTQIAFRRGTPGDVYVMAADGSGSRRIGHDGAAEEQPAWSPDGRWIAYSRKTTGTSIREIWLVHPDGSSRSQLTHLGASSRAPAWSPDSTRIAFSSDQRHAGIFEIYIVGVDGKHVRPLTVSGANSFEPSWSPDGKTIAFWSNGAIFTVDLQGRQQQLSNGDGNDSSPVWRPVQPAENPSG